LIAGGSKIYVTSKVNKQIQSDLEGMQQNARYALDQIVRDIRRSGYYGGINDPVNVSGSDAPVESDGSCTISDNNWGRMLSRPLFGLNDGRDGYNCIPEKDYLRGDVVTMRYANALVTRSFDPGRLYMRTSLTKGTLFTGNREAEPVNQIPGRPVTVREIVSNVYYIRTSSTLTCPDGSRPPSLYREHLNAKGQPVAEEIAVGIENLQIQYGIDTNDNGSVNRFLDADEVSDWKSVVQVRAWLLARQECSNAGFIDSDKSYLMGSLNYQPESTGYRRLLFFKSIRLRNS
jgi:Tfp pilus assembly protein PilW